MSCVSATLCWEPNNLYCLWKDKFGYTHGVVCDAFYEKISRHRVEGREFSADEAEENMVLEFRSQVRQEMLVPCLNSHCRGEGEEQWSFAAIIDEPPPELAAAENDPCIILIKDEC